MNDIHIDSHSHNDIHIGVHSDIDIDIYSDFDIGSHVDFDIDSDIDRHIEISSSMGLTSTVFSFL